MYQEDYPEWPKTIASGPYLQELMGQVIAWKTWGDPCKHILNMKTYRCEECGEATLPCRYLEDNGVWQVVMNGSA